MMTRNLLVVAALLLTNLGGNAAAAEPKNELKSKKAQKIIATLESIGINNKELRQLIAEADQRVHGKYLHLSEYAAPGGKVVLRYKMGKMPSVKTVELAYTPDPQGDFKDFELVAKTQSVMLRYQYQLPVNR